MAVYSIELDYKNKYDLVFKYVKIYNVCNLLKDEKLYLRPKLVELLAWYVLMGYSNETKDLIMQTYQGMDKKTLNQMNSELIRKKYLNKHKYRNLDLELHPSLLSLKEYVLSENSKRKPFVIVFEDAG